MEMKNDKGDVIAILNIDLVQEDNAIDNIIRGLKPGMGKGIYLVNEKKISQQTNYAAVRWLEGLDELKAKAPLWEPVFPVNAEMMDIHIFYGFDNLTQEEIDEMALESERSGKSVVRDLRPNDTIVGVSVFYRKQESTFEFRIFGTTKSRIQVPNIDQHTIESLTIRTNEAVYVGDSEKQKLIWAEVGPNKGKVLQYEVLAERSNRDWLVSIAESLA
jgi:hypothetical protein